MQITKSLSEGILTVAIEGRLDTITAPVLEGELKQSVTDEVKMLIFDFARVVYMSSAGIRVIMSADKVMAKQGGMKLIHVNEEIMDILNMTGLTDFLVIE